MQARLLTLPKRQQILLGAGVVFLLAGSFMLTGSLIPLGALIALTIGYAVIRNPVWSICAFVVINVVIAIRPRTVLANDAPTALDLVFGIFLIGIIGYWIVKVRFFEGLQFNQSVGQLCMSLFTIWAIFVTALGFIFTENPFNTALREILNFLPMLILPVLYERFIEPDSKAEQSVMILILLAAGIMVIASVIQVRNNLAQAVYLYQTGYGKADSPLSGFLTLIAISMIISTRRSSRLTGPIIGLVCAILGVVISFKRGLYLATLLTTPILFFFSTPDERRKGFARLFVILLIGIICMIPVYYSSRFLRLMLTFYSHRFISSQNVTTDLSITNRYAEARYCLQAIMRSPIFGAGFGARFRTFQIIDRVHVWTGYCHNSYLYMIFKTGFVGAALFFAAFGSIILKGIKILRSPYCSTKYRIIVRASIAYLFLFLLVIYAEPAIDGKTDLMWIGLIWGYFLALENKIRKDETADSIITTGAVQLS
jgi:O-antigen ligase